MITGKKNNLSLISTPGSKSLSKPTKLWLIINQCKVMKLIGVILYQVELIGFVVDFLSRIENVGMYRKNHLSQWTKLMELSFSVIEFAAQFLVTSLCSGFDSYNRHLTIAFFTNTQNC